MYQLISENLALHKPAYQLHPYKGSNGSQADAAVDGLKNNTAVWGDQCVISEKGKDIAIWWVNLTRISSIHHVMIYYVTGRMQWGMYIFYTDSTINNTNLKKKCYLNHNPHFKITTIIYEVKEI